MDAQKDFIQRFHTSFLVNLSRKIQFGAPIQQGLKYFVELRNISLTEERAQPVHKS